MSNTAKIIITLVGAILLASIVYQQYELKNQKETLGKTIDELTSTEGTLKEQLYNTDSTNQVYEIRIKRLQDKVYALKKRVAKLNQQLQNQSDIILENRKTIETLQTESKNLLNVIAQMRSDKNTNTDKIADLEEKRFQLDKKIGELFMKNDTLERKIVNETVEKAALKENIQTLTDKETIFDIQNNVKVVFANVLARKDDVKDRAKSAKRWKKTVINLNLNYEDLDLVMNEFFMVQLIDEDTKTVLPPRESNSGDDTQGLLFRFKGNPIPQIIYPNHEKKSGKNYAVRIFYVKKDKLYSMNNGGYQRIDFGR